MCLAVIHAPHRNFPPTHSPDPTDYISPAIKASYQKHMGFQCRLCAYDGKEWTVASAVFAMQTGEMGFEFQCPECDSTDIALIIEGDDDFMFGLDIPDDIIDAVDPSISSFDISKDDMNGIFEEWLAEDEDDPTFIP